MTKASHWETLNYDWVEPGKRSELVDRVNQGEKLVRVASELGIKYGNAKCIMAADRKHRRNPGTRRRKMRAPKLKKIFLVEKVAKAAGNRVHAAVMPSAKSIMTSHKPRASTMVVEIELDGPPIECGTIGLKSSASLPEV